MDTYSIEPVRGHYEVYKNGSFMCSADTVVEAANEVDKDRYGIAIYPQSIINKEE